MVSFDRRLPETVTLGLNDKLFQLSNPSTTGGGYVILNAGLNWTDGQTVTISFKNDYDVDNDNLIEVDSLAQLNAIRWDLDGNGSPTGDNGAYAAAFPHAAASMSCAATCIGYELTADLDFDTDGSGTANSGDTYWNGGAGWEPIGRTTAYTGEFHGNGQTIASLHINRTRTLAGLLGIENQVGLFGKIGGAGFVHHVGLLNASVRTAGHDVGALVGFTQGNQTRVAASYATGTVAGTGQTGGAGRLQPGHDTGFLCQRCRKQRRKQQRRTDRTQRRSSHRFLRHRHRHRNRGQHQRTGGRQHRHGH